MKLNVGLSKVFWVKIVNMFYYIINKSPYTALDDKTLKDLWIGKLKDCSGLIIFDCVCYVYIQDSQRSKLDSKSK